MHLSGERYKEHLRFTNRLTIHLSCRLAYLRVAAFMSTIPNKTKCL